jgi:myosin-crossreactive antigen
MRNVMREGDMSHVETLQAMLERRLIGQMARALDDSTDQAQRERQLRALRDLVLHADQTLDARLIDEWTEAHLRRHNLWVWDRMAADA